MFQSLADLRKARGNFDDLRKEVEKLANPGFNKDEDGKYWQPTVDKAGNGYAVIRFLPAPMGETTPWVRVWNHGFQGPTGKWYIENSLTTLGQTDPVSELNSELWNTGDEAKKEIARKQKRRLQYISNILVVKDSANPENEGKVFLFKYGKKIFDKIKDAMQPQFEDEKPINPFDFDLGANFMLKIRKVEDYRNYDKSEFASPSPVSDDDATLEEIWKSCASLQDFLDAKHFKSYDELKKRLVFVLGSGARATAETTNLDRTEEAVEPKKAAAKPPAAKIDTEEDDDDDTMSYFEGLANDD